MKHRFLYIIALLIGCFMLQPVFGAEEASREADHEALRSLRQKAVDALNNLDLDALASIMAKDFVFTTIDGTVLTNQADMKAYYDRMFAGKDAPLASIKIEAEATILTRFIDEKTGWNYGTARETYSLRNGDEVTLQTKWTATVVKEGENWKIGAVHIGINVLENPILSKAKSVGKTLGFSAGLAGLCIGFLICLVVRRKKRGSEIASS